MQHEVKVKCEDEVQTPEVQIQRARDRGRRCHRNGLPLRRRGEDEPGGERVEAVARPKRILRRLFPAALIYGQAKGSSTTKVTLVTLSEWERTIEYKHIACSYCILVRSPSVNMGYFARHVAMQFTLERRLINMESEGCDYQVRKIVSGYL